MRKNCDLEVLGRKLLLKGLPASYVSRCLGELRDHLDDASLANIESGMDRNQAAREAEKALGTPPEMAEASYNRLSNSTFFGRHRFLIFAFGPMFAIALWWALWLFLGLWASGVLKYDSKAISGFLPNWELALMWIEITKIAGYVALPWLIIFTGKRTYTSWPWVLFACLILAFHHGFNAVQFDISSIPGAPISFTWGYAFSTDYSQLNAGGFVLPIVFFLGFFLFNLNQGQNQIHKII